MTTTTPTPNRFTTLLAQAFREKQRADHLSAAWLWNHEQASALAAISGALLACLAILEAIQCDDNFPEAIADILKDLSEQATDDERS